MGAALCAIRSEWHAWWLPCRLRRGAARYGYPVPVSDRFSPPADLDPDYLNAIGPYARFNTGVYRLDERTAVKIKDLISLRQEYESIRYIRQHDRSIPIANAFALFTVKRSWGNRTKKRYDTSGEAALVMEWVEGMTVAEWYRSRDAGDMPRSGAARRRIMEDLKQAMRKLRELPQDVEPGSVGSVSGGPIPDLFLWRGRDRPKGPWSTVSGFYDFLVFDHLATHEADGEHFGRPDRPPSRIRQWPDAPENRAKFEDDVPVVFTHADLQCRNVMVSPDGRLAAIIDWEWAGFYPAWWEYFHSYVCSHDNIQLLTGGQDTLEELLPLYPQATTYMGEPFSSYGSWM